MLTVQLKLNPGLKAVGGSDKAPGTNTIVKDGDQFKLGSLDIKCLSTPCHTQDSICFFVEDKAKNQRGVFTGWVAVVYIADPLRDTLFLAGCGRFFEGAYGYKR